jgi:hypothetical protein
VHRAFAQPCERHVRPFRAAIVNRSLRIVAVGASRTRRFNCRDAIARRKRWRREIFPARASGRGRGSIRIVGAVPGAADCCSTAGSEEESFSICRSDRTSMRGSFMVAGLLYDRMVSGVGSRKVSTDQSVRAVVRVNALPGGGPVH